jgi:hypothetical protein
MGLVSPFSIASKKAFARFVKLLYQRNKIRWIPRQKLFLVLITDFHFWIAIANTLILIL